MASYISVVTLAPLVPGLVSIDSKTIALWLQVSIASGVYQVGGIPTGILAAARAATVNDSVFLQAEVLGETTTSGHNYTYKYIPSTDALQIFDNGTELGASGVMPAGVIGDVIVARVTYNRLPA